ncbi:hypothetical protein [Nibricoccus sp. IMCC34717]|uniref:hypothetical protein n=1 Tax=Nibricoccus sp. IMCC34717 TaxID=3034021 RepID=UPI00384C7E11
MDSREPLSRLLRDWQCQPKADPCFGSAVWDRIRSSEAAGAEPSRILQFWSSLPLGWAAAAVVLVGGFTAGSAAFAFSEMTHDQRHVAAYVRSIDPIQRSAQAHTHEHANHAP